MEPMILYEDSDLLAVDKPSGMIVNKADTTKHELTLQEWAESYLHVAPGSLRHERDDFLNRGGIVHRLDKETSGVILLAKTPDTFHQLQAQFKARTVQKTYQTLVHGRVTPKKGDISAPIGRLPWNRMRFGVVPDGRESLTTYEVLETYALKNKRNEELSLLNVFPKTGRTHQIRVHMKHINHPVFSDSLYAGRKNARDDRRYLQRIFLQAVKITFTHPTNHSDMTVSVPLAQELSDFLIQHCEVVVESK